MVVSASEQGKTQLRAIPRGFLVDTQQRVRRYQELRRARARLVEIHRQMLKAMDEMEAMRREDLPCSGKKQYGIDVLIPIRCNMDIYADAMALFGESEVQWVECKQQRQEANRLDRPRRPRVVAKREKKRQKKLCQLKQQQPQPPQALLKLSMLPTGKI
jgi:hypothetical protein